MRLCVPFGQHAPQGGVGASEKLTPPSGSGGPCPLTLRSLLCSAALKARARARVRLDVDERRSQLVDLGLAEFGDRTYDDVSIDHIATRAGISKGLLYHYFPTKKAFYVACIREAAARLLRRVNEVPLDGNPLETMNARVDAYLDYVRARGPAYSHLMRSGTGIDRQIGVIVEETRSALLAQITEGLSIVLPTAKRSPMVTVALQGWVGLAEASSIAWVEACVADETTAPPASAVRELLTRAFVAIIQSLS